MAFITTGSTVLSFADYDDVVSKDQRIFESNEGLTSDIVEDALVRATGRIISMIRNTSWWKGYFIRQSGGTNGVIINNDGVLVPAPNANYVRDRQSDFTDLCVYYALSEYILPRVADFGNAESAERQKIGFYDEKARVLFRELIDAGDWYDFDNDGSIVATEKSPTVTNLKRVR